MKKPGVIIIGGGAAGLLAANDLCEKCEVTILESRHEFGGRIRSFSLSEGRGVIEAGAEFIHGDLPITNKLIIEAGLEKNKVEGKTYRREKKEWIVQEEMIEGWNELIEKMKGQRNDMTMEAFLMKNFPGDEHAALRRHIKLFVNGFDLADPEKISIQSLYHEWSNEGDQYRLRDGYGALIRFLVSKCKSGGCRMETGRTVKQIDWQKNDITVYTSDGMKFRSEKVIITVPVSVLRDIKGKNAINFTPPVDEYIRAAHSIGYGTVVKLIFDFSNKFWKKDMSFVLSEEMVPVWWTQLPIKNNLLTGWAGGPMGERLGTKNDDEIIEAGLRSLSAIFEETLAELRNNLYQSYVFNWIRYEDTLGAYSYSYPESKAAREILNNPLAESVFFAGEALFEGEYPGTVEAAFKSGRDASLKLLKSLK